MLAVTYTYVQYTTLHLYTPVKSEAHMCCTDVSIFGASIYIAHMNSALNRSSVIQHLEHSSVIKINNFITRM